MHAVTLTQLSLELWCLEVPLPNGDTHRTHLEIKLHENPWKVAGPVVALIERCFPPSVEAVAPAVEPEQVLVPA